MDKEELIKFEEEIAELFNGGNIFAPVHLYNGNEDQIINVFKKVRSQDWVFCSWRSHYQCLLKGVPQTKLRAKFLQVVRFLSVSLNIEFILLHSWGEHLPIAVGTAMAEKRKKEDSIVYCFMGDMTSETGIAHECIKFSCNHQLPIHFIIEDNSKSVCTDTRETWNCNTLSYESKSDPMITYYRYETKYPHAGAGTRVQF